MGRTGLAGRAAALHTRSKMSRSPTPVLATAGGRDDSAIERSVSWFTAASANELLNEGATLFVADAEPTPDGYDFTHIDQALTWRATVVG